MTGYKSILAVATAVAEMPRLVGEAGRLTLEQDAHLDILGVSVDRSQLGYSYIDGGPVLAGLTAQRAADAAAGMEKSARDAAGELPVALRWSLQCVVSQPGAAGRFVAGRARLADLTVLVRPYTGLDDSDNVEALESVLFEGRSAVLVLPATGTMAVRPARVVVGWNESNEALSAVRSAMPFLCAAAMVNVVVVDPRTRSPGKEEPGSALCQLLARHGARAEVVALPRTRPSVSETLSHYATEHGADLVVMGAYGRSRLSEAILGGATRDLLEKASFPLFLAR